MVQHSSDGESAPHSEGMGSWLRVPMEARDRVVAFQLLAPLALGLFLSRLFKVTSVAFVVDQVDGSSFSRQMFHAVMLSVFVGAAVALRRPVAEALSRLKPVWRITLACLASTVPVIAIVSYIFGRKEGFADRWMGRLLLQLHVFRGDVTFVVVFAVIMFIVLKVTSGRVRGIAVGLLTVVVAVSLVLAALDLSYFRATGLNGDAFAFHFLLANLSSMGFLLQSGINWPNIAIVTFYALLLPVSIWLGRRAVVADVMPRVQNLPRLVLTLAAVVTALWLAPSHRYFNYPYARISRQLHSDVLVDLLKIRSATAAPRKRSKTAIDKPLNDWRHLTFVSGPTTRRLNVVLIILESMRARSVTPYNRQLATTPFLAELAERSLLVEDLNAVIPQTSKAWTAILTGMHPVTTTLDGLSLANNSVCEVPSLPKLLRPHGYRSAFFTPAHLKFENDMALIRCRGFDVIRSDGDYDTTGFEHSNYYGFEDRIMLRPSLAWVDEERAAGQPFMLTYMTLTGHHDYQVPSTYSKVRYPGVEDDELNDYLNAVHYIDDFLRDLFAAFERRNLMDSTVFVMLGDHGQSFGEHGARQHHEVLFDEALRIPGFVYAPSLWHEPGRIVGPRQQIDVLPTIADALGFQISGGYLEGTSLLRPVPADRTLFFMDWRDNAHLALRHGSRKYLYTFDSGQLQSFDLDRDPMEQRDLALSLPAAETTRIVDEMFEWQNRVTQGFLAKLGE